MKTENRAGKFYAGLRRKLYNHTRGRWWMHAHPDPDMFHDVSDQSAQLTNSQLFSILGNQNWTEFYVSSQNQFIISLCS